LQRQHWKLRCRNTIDMHNFVTLCHGWHLTMIPKVMEHTVHNFNNELKIKLYIVEGICIHDGLYSYEIVLCRCYARNVCSQVRTGMYHTSNICVKKIRKIACTTHSSDKNNQSRHNIYIPLWTLHDPKSEWKHWQEDVDNKMDVDVACLPHRRAGRESSGCGRGNMRIWVELYLTCGVARVIHAG
jgi:hypothetical protein